ncbi:flavin-containing monooxygenase [Streptomyces sp. NPDC127038]|uniref:flavin-containing monooxygenase n=1 Tax=Streptomyces sp. NPDC127038 TaxID=3347114 RepID=UPI00365195F4
MEKVCVIGAGSSGIAACQVLAARGIAYDCYETGSGVGGNWRYLNDNGMSSAYRSLHINTSRQIMEYASFPMPRDCPVYPSHFHIARYFDSFVDHFGLRPSIAFRTEVVRVEPAPGGRWSVTSRDLDSGATTERLYGAVLVANGHHWKPRWPEPSLPGADTFTGVQTHSHDYRTPEPFADRRVLVLGIGNSACDIAVETSRVSRRTVLAMRRGAHILPKYLFGVPTDHLTGSWLARAPLAVQERGLRLLLRLSRGRLSDYGLPTPRHRVLGAHPTISDDLLSRLGHGDLTVKPAPVRLEGDRVTFEDGSAEEFDAVVYCTGYDIAFPFLGAEVIDPSGNDIELYHRVVAPDRPGLYFIGLVQPLGAIMPLAEAQAHWVADLLEGRCALPGPERMRRETSAYRAGLARRYVASTRHTIQVDAGAYLRELRAERRRGAARVRRRTAGR